MNRTKDIIMFLLSLVFLTGVMDVQTHLALCNDDIHCSEGFFCHTMTYSCQKCLSCELLKRSPGPNENDCIKSDKQCGPCFQGLIKDETHWDAMCMSPDPKNEKIRTSYIYVMAICVVIGVLLSILIMHDICNTHIITVKIAIPSHKTMQPSVSEKTPMQTA